MDSYIPASVIHDRHGVLAHHHHPHQHHHSKQQPQQPLNDPRTPRGFNLATNIHLAELQECFNQPNSEDEAEEREYQEAKRERLRKKQLKKEIKAQKKRERLKERELKKSRRKLKCGSQQLLPNEDEDESAEQDPDRGLQDLEESVGQVHGWKSRQTKKLAQTQEQRQKDILTAAVAAQLNGEVHRESGGRGRAKDIASEWASGYSDRDRSESDELRVNGGFHSSRVVQFLLSTAGKLGGRRSRATTGETTDATGHTGTTSRQRGLSSKGGPSTYSDVELTTLDYHESVEQQRPQPTSMLSSHLRQRLVRERSHTDQGSTILLQSSADGPPNGGGGGMESSSQLLHPHTRSALQPHARSHSHEHRLQFPRVGGGMLGFGSPLKQRHARSHSNLEAEQTILQNGPQTSSMSNSTSSRCYLHRVLQKLRRSKDCDLKNKIL